MKKKTRFAFNAYLQQLARLNGVEVEELSSKFTVETAVQTETEPDQDFQGRERLKLSLFTVYYPEEWKYDKERMQNMR